jgi:IS605 OrfB family transposase
MQQTYQDRLDLTPMQQRWLDAFGALYGTTQRKLYAQVAKGEVAMDLKVRFCNDYGLSARQFNALRIELAGKIDSTIELLKVRKTDLKSGIKATLKSIAKISKSIAVQKSAKWTKEKQARQEKQLFGKKRRLVSLNEKLISIDRRLRANAPGICFGSRKLFNQQFHLDATTFGVGEAGHAVWKKAWQDARSHQFFLIGSKDETAGNSSCKAQIVHAPPTTEVAMPTTLTLTVKMPQSLVLLGAPKFLSIEKVRFEYGHAQILEALADGIALSYRFHRDNSSPTGWRVFVASDIADKPKTSLSTKMGVLGVDFNADHLAWSRTDRFGNPIEAGRINMHQFGKTSGQRTAILSEALDALFAIAKKHLLAVALEDLDFTAKKQELKKLGERRARMLSGIAYSKFKQLAQSKSSRLGVDLHFVNPAYTSVAGLVKYAAPLGRCVHQAAAGVIARRAQGYSEKLPKTDADGVRTLKAPLMGCVAVLHLPVRNRCESTRAIWGVIRRSLSQHCAELVRVRKRPSRQRNTPESVSMPQLDGAFVPSRESGSLLSRRANQTILTDVPF